MFIIPYIQWVLLALVKSGDYDRASSVLQEKCTDLDLNCRDYENGRTVLFYTAASGKFDLVLKLLEEGANINIADMEGKSPLILAAEQSQELEMLLLLDHGSHIHFKQDTTGRTALFFAAENGHDAAVSILLAYGADPNQKDVDGETPRTLAERNGKVCEELLPPEQKKQPDVRSDSFQYKYISESLHSLSKRFQTVRVALFGRDQAAVDLVEAAKNDDLTTVQYILQKGREWVATNIDTEESEKHGWTPLMWASDRGNVNIVELLLDKGADLNKASKVNEWSSLMIASRKGHLKVVKTLSERGANIDHQNINGLTSLNISLFEQRTAVATFLIYKGANINLAEHTGWSPLIRASKEGSLKLLQIIADRGGRLNDQTMFGWTSVMVASKHGHEKVVNELAKRGADLTLTTKDGDTALHIATMRRYPGILEQLGKQGANLDIPNSDGLTALMVSANKGYKSEIDALLSGGADVNYAHKGTGWTAIFFAAKNGSVEIVQKLLHHGAKTELHDGTRLIDVASHLKQMSIMHVLGTSVDLTPTATPQQPQNVDRNVRTLEAIFIDLEERVRAWTKV